MGLSAQAMKTFRLEVGSHCHTCNSNLVPRVMYSRAGYYVGTACKCGPFSRESDYYNTEAEAQEALGD